MRMTIGRLMMVVAAVALLSAIGLAVPPTIDPLMRDRGLRLGIGLYVAVVIVMICLISAPLIAGLALSWSAFSRTRTLGRLPVRRTLAAVGLLGLSYVLIFQPLPLDSLRQADWVDPQTCVMYYQQYRIWPGSHVTPCLETLTRNGERKTYPIPVTDAKGSVHFWTNPERTRIWITERMNSKTQKGRVLGTLDRVTGQFIAAPGPFPSEVTEPGGIAF